MIHYRLHSCLFVVLLFVSLFSIFSSADTPYAPFPWPCDEASDCQKPSFNNNEPSVEVYYSYPKKETEARVPPSKKRDSFIEEEPIYFRPQYTFEIVVEETPEMVTEDTPYAPFPWPCDEASDCQKPSVHYKPSFEVSHPYSDDELDFHLFPVKEIHPSSPPPLPLFY